MSALPADYSSFTLVFKGDIREFKMNPLTTETPWGIPYAVCCWDSLEHADELSDALERASKPL